MTYRNTKLLLNLRNKSPYLPHQAENYNRTLFWRLLKSLRDVKQNNQCLYQRTLEAKEPKGQVKGYNSEGAR
jgi:hypothetical protein